MFLFHAFFSGCFLSTCYYRTHFHLEHILGSLVPIMAFPTTIHHQDLNFEPSRHFGLCQRLAMGMVIVTGIPLMVKRNPARKPPVIYLRNPSKNGRLSISTLVNSGFLNHQHQPSYSLFESRQRRNPCESVPCRTKQVKNHPCRCSRSRAHSDLVEYGEKNRES